jgi:F-type H+-transporting ATPase subunit a
VDIASVIKLTLAAAAGAAAFVFRRRAIQKASAENAPPGYKKNIRQMTMIMAISAWYFIGVVISAFAGAASGFSLGFILFGFSFSGAVVITWAIVLLALAISLIFRYFVLPKFRDKPRGFQNIVEAAVEWMQKSTKLLTVLMALCVWYFVGSVISALMGGGSGGLTVEFQMFPARTVLYGLSVSGSAIITWAIILVVLALSLIFRYALFPKFTAKPDGFQNIMEAVIEGMEKFTRGVTGPLSRELPIYMFAIALLLIGSAVSELFGQRPPTSDLIMTFTMGLITFSMINFLSIKHKGLRGRIKSMASPSPIMLPMKILSDIAVPISLASRLFGNMLGGMIVMDLLKSALGGYSVGVTALAGVYFNVFHPLIQAYIFIILSLTFINEAAE